MTSPALVFRRVRFAYGTTPVVASFDLEVAAGEMVGVLGPNGVGKTTLVRLASGALAPDAGHIELFGDDLARLSARERARRVAVVPQETDPVFEFTVEEIVRMGRTPHLGWLGLEGPEDRAIAQDALARCALEGVAARSFRALSGGERRRVLLARALTQGARLLLLDEPTAYLDLKHRLAVYDLLARLRVEGGPTVVVVSHDINLAARRCDRLVLLCCGAVLADGPPGDVLTRETIREAYDVEVEIARDAATGRPFVIPLAPGRPA